MSAVDTLDLWPDDIRADVLSPVAVLRAQEIALRQKTQGILRAEVRTQEIKDEGEETGNYIHKLDLVAPALGNYRITLMAAIHDTSMIYPALVKSRIFDPSQNPSKISVPIKPGFSAIMFPQDAVSKVVEDLLRDKPHPEFRLAATQDDFIKLVSDVLHSGSVRSLIQSLVARSNAVPLLEAGTAAASDSSSDSDQN